MGKGKDQDFTNPGTIDLQRWNPEAYKEISNMRGLRDAYRSSGMYALDGNQYQNRINEQMDKNTIGMSNQYASMGLAGSSTMFSGLAEANRQTQFAWDDRRNNEIMQAMQMEASLSGQINSDIYGIQNQYGQTQQQKNAAIAQQNAERNALIGKLAGAAIGAGAMVASGGASAAAPAASGASAAAMPAAQNAGYGFSNYSVGQAAGMYGGSGYGSGNYGWSGYN